MEIKEFNIMYNIGKAKYVLNYYVGKKHKDKSKFFDIAIFKNKKELNKFLKKGGIKENGNN